ncbi:MAG: hypothetical protein AAGG11_01225 [Pseudomonadota bacterium]
MIEPTIDNSTGSLTGAARPRRCGMTLGGRVGWTPIAERLAEGLRVPS